MSSGANIGDGGPDGIGDNPTDLGAWEKLQLGWLDYDVAEAGKPSSHRLGPAEGTTRNGKQGLVVVLPDKSVSTPVVAPKTGDWSYWSGMGDLLDNTMTKPMTLPAGATISADVWLRHRGALRLRVPRGLDRQRGQLDADQDEPLAARVGRPGAVQLERHGDRRLQRRRLPADGDQRPAADRHVLVRFRYRTDQNTGGKGVVFDNIAGHRSAARRRRDRRRLGVRRLQPDGERRRRDAEVQRVRRREPRVPRATTRRSRRPTTSASSTRGRTGSSRTRTRTGS